MADAWGGSWGQSWGESWGSDDHARPAGRPSKDRRRRKRYVLPNGMHVYATAEEAVQVAEQLLSQRVVVEERRPKKRTKLIVLDDGARIQAPVVYPAARLASSVVADERVRASQVAPDQDILPQLLLKLAGIRIEEERRRRRRNTALALLYSS